MRTGAQHIQLPCSRSDVRVMPVSERQSLGFRQLSEVRVNIKFHQHVGKAKVRLHCSSIRDNNALCEEAFSVGLTFFNCLLHTTLSRKNEERTFL